MKTYKAGEKLCACTLLQYCGAGGSGEVWLAENAVGGKVALKIIRGKYSERELEGLRNYKDCDHQNLLKIRHIEINDDGVFCTMDAADDLNHGVGEYLPDTLANRLNKYGRLDGKEISAMLNDLLAALEELHKHGLVHRDIKPDNILWVNGRVTLSDAGLIATTGKHTLVGTPGFVSPRLLESGGVAETSDDFYALSKVIYCALTGLAPAEYPTIPPEMTISLDPVISKATRVGCTQEVKSSAEFKKLITGKSVANQPQENIEKQAAIVKIKLTVAIIVAMLAAMAGFYWLSETGAVGEVKNGQSSTVSIRSDEPENRPKESVAVSGYSLSKNDTVSPKTYSGKIFSIPEPQIDKSEVADFEERFGISRDVDLQEWFFKLGRIQSNYTAENFETEYLRDRGMKVQELFRRTGLYSEKYLEELLTRKIFSAKTVENRIDVLSQKYYARDPAIQIGRMSISLRHLRLTNQRHDRKLAERQQYWKSQPGTANDVITRMLSEDPVMQMAAVNMLLERFCRQVLQTFKYDTLYDQIIPGLVSLQNEFTIPLADRK